MARLVVYCGLPGVGKSTASAYTAEQLGARRYRSDETRKELFDAPTYSAAESAVTYETMFARAQADLDDGEDVVLDATFGSKRTRDRAVRVGREADADRTLARVTCPTEVVRERIADREDVSDADFEVHLQHRERFDPIDREHVVIDNGGSVVETRRQVDLRVLDAE